MTRLKIYAFGPPRLEQGEQITEIGLRKALALVVYLAVTRQAHSRDTLATLLWPESDQREGRGRLRRLLHRLAELLGTNLLATEGDSVGLRPDFELWLDCAAFRDEIRAGLPASPDQAISGERIAHLESAVELYRAEFLAGFTLSDSPEFDEWQFFQRESLHQLYGQALEQLAHAHQCAGSFSEAIGYARRWVALDTLHEPAHRALMRIYALGGQQAAALRQYQECARVLEAELGAEPEAETQALYEAIRGRQLGPPSAEPIQQHSTPPHNLPAQLSSFVGREVELAAIEGLLLGETPHRLLTLAGPGGVGKTRLALATAEAQLRGDSAFPDGVFFVALAPLGTPAGIVPALADALRFTFASDSPPVQQLCEYLRPRRVLIVLDNMEHLLGAEALELISAILAAAPKVALLATSRARLNLQGEAIFAVSGLAVASEVSSAAELFAQRARRVQPDFALSEANLPAVNRICALVQGMPLGIELAAAWAEMLAPAEIAAEIERSLDFLVGDWRDMPARQRSLRAVLDAAWGRLDAPARDALQALTLFRAPFERDAAQAVAGASLQTLRLLVNESWLQRADANRFTMHELMRQYAAEVLARDPAALRRGRDRHAAYFGALLHQLDKQMRGSQPQTAFAAMRAAFDDARAAWLWRIEQGEMSELLDQMLPTMFRYGELDSQGFAVLPLLETAQHAIEASTYAQRDLYVTILLAARGAFLRTGYSLRAELLPDVPGPTFADGIARAWGFASSQANWGALGFWGVLLATEYAWTSGDAQAGIAQLRELIHGLRAAGPRWDLAFALQSLGRLLFIRMPDDDPEPLLAEALDALREALALFEALGDARESGNTLRLLGSVHLLLQDLPEARYHFEAAQHCLMAIDDWGHATSIHWQLADIHFQLGNRAAAFQHLQQMNEANLARGRLDDATVSLSRESYEALRYSDLDHARATRMRNLSLSCEAGNTVYEAWDRWELGEIERVAGNFALARQHFEQSRTLFSGMHERAFVWYQGAGACFYHRGLGDIAFASGDPAAAERHFQQSLAFATEAGSDWSVTYALAGLARANCALGQHATARTHLHEALSKVRKFTDGIVLLVLSTVAELYASTGEFERAHALATLVIAHPLTWHEIRTRAELVAETCAQALGNLNAPAQSQPGNLRPLLTRLTEEFAQRTA